MPSPQVFAATDGAVYTTSNGAAVAHPLAAERVGPVGPLLLQDFHHIDLLAHFDRERIPERVVHAKGAGAHGYFETTHDLSDITSCKLFTNVGKQVRLTARFSTVGGESGSADTARDPRDWVFNNTPVFFIRDPAKFPPFIHTQKRLPVSNPESAHQVMILFSDRGIPDGYHNMHGYSGHTFKLVKDDGSWVYTQIHCIADGGCKVLDTATARDLSADNPDHGIQSLFETIDAGNFPSWTVYVKNFRYNVLDLTKVWPHKDYPLRPVGKFVLNENPQNYFAEIEQAAFAPSHLVPYFEASADPIPVNAPIISVANFQRDGAMAFNNQGARPNYQSFYYTLDILEQQGIYQGTPRDYERAKQHESWVGGAFWDLSEITELDFEQPRALYQNVMDDAARARLVSNVAGHLGGAKSAEVKARTLSYFASVDQSLSDRIAKAIGAPTAKPLAVKPASEAVRFRHGVGAAL
ncbi:catalase-like domain-containing protein [Suillus subalutaceus]|uniref:catalase-like domain-containing protein n=1 Tax=Suillus subalutaceus TaxID=48586 RepID=UPI001B8847C1|nr:catalase-like domain-containing protein [Suillus subalutaceus]KAG1852890.1 catalase-like domain-containing protein [Suillus subalutaceus]